MKSVKNSVFQAETHSLQVSLQISVLFYVMIETVEERRFFTKKTKEIVKSIEEFKSVTFVSILQTEGEKKDLKA